MYMFIYISLYAYSCTSNSPTKEHDCSTRIERPRQSCSFCRQCECWWPWPAVSVA